MTKTKENKYLKFLKEYVAVITLSVTVLAFIFNVIINYYQKSSSTEFYIQYLTVKLDNEDWVRNYNQNNYYSSYLDELKAPTFNNALNKLLYQHPDKVKNYFVKYLIIKQRKEVEALDVKINFKQYGKVKSLENHELVDFPVDMNIFKKVTETVEYPFPKDELLKIPISICEMENEYSFDSEKCYYIMLEPVSIEYRNKYSFSKRKVAIRNYVEHKVIIDGQVVTGKGGTPTNSNEKKAWYLK